jgi:hypothetical protein
MWEAGWVGSLGRLSGWLSVSLGLGDGPMNLSSRVMNIIYIYIYIYICIYICMYIYVCIHIYVYIHGEAILHLSVFCVEVVPSL